MFVILPVCRLCHASPCLSLFSPASSLQPLFTTVILPLPVSPFFCHFNLSLSHSVVPSLVPGRQLEAVEGPPVVPRLHGDENPTGGSPVQQEETIAGGPREEPKPPSEISGAASSKSKTNIHQHKTRHSRLGDCLHMFCMYWCFEFPLVNMPVSQLFTITVLCL